MRQHSNSRICALSQSLFFSGSRADLNSRFFQRRSFSSTVNQEQIDEYQAALSVSDPTTFELAINRGFALLSMHQPDLLIEANYCFKLAEKFLNEKKGLSEEKFQKYRQYINCGNEYLSEYSKTKKFKDDSCLEYINTLFISPSCLLNRY